MLTLRIEKRLASDNSAAKFTDFGKLRIADLFLHNGLAFVKISDVCAINLHTAEGTTMFSWSEVIKIKNPLISGQMD